MLFELIFEKMRVLLYLVAYVLSACPECPDCDSCDDCEVCTHCIEWLNENILDCGHLNKKELSGTLMVRQHKLIKPFARKYSADKLRQSFRRIS